MTDVYSALGITVIALAWVIVSKVVSGNRKVKRAFYASVKQGMDKALAAISSESVDVVAVEIGFRQAEAFVTMKYGSLEAFLRSPVQERIKFMAALRDAENKLLIVEPQTALGMYLYENWLDAKVCGLDDLAESALSCLGEKRLAASRSPTTTKLASINHRHVKGFDDEYDFR